jgi:HSP20 family protein
MSNTAIQKRESETVNVPARGEKQLPSYVFTPLVDVIETHDEFLFQADLPGAKAGDVDVSYDNGVLTINGKIHPRQPANQAYAWQEYGVGDFYRQFSIGTPVEPDGIKAELKNGVLEVRLPKAESAKTRRIEIKSD